MKTQERSEEWIDGERNMKEGKKKHEDGDIERRVGNECWGEN